MRALGLAMLAGCADPISNALILSDAEFVDAFPTADRLGPPVTLLAAPVGDAEHLALALDAALDLEDELAGLLLTGETLRDTLPDVRTETFRGWSAVPVVHPSGGSWWTRGDVTRPEGGARTWSIEVAADPEGPWVQLAVGVHEASGNGALRFGLPGVLGSTQELEAAYTIETGERRVDVASSSRLGSPGDRYWQIIGDSGLGWTGLFDPAGDGPRPGVMFALQALDGGRAEGFLSLDGELATAFASCWDAAGNEVWRGGDPGVPQAGDPDRCVVGPIFDGPP